MYKCAEKSYISSINNSNMKKLILTLAAIATLASCTKEELATPAAAKHDRDGDRTGMVVVIPPDSFQALQGTEILAWSSTATPDVYNFDVMVPDGCAGQPGQFQAYTDGLWYRSLPTKIRIKIVYLWQPQGCGDTLYFNQLGFDLSPCRDGSPYGTYVLPGSAPSIFLQ